MVGIVTVIDSALVQGQIQKVLISDPDSWALYQQVVDFAPLEAARDAWQQAVSSGAAAEAVSQLYGAVELAAENISRSLYGNYSGALTIYNLPLSLMAAITASVIAAVSAAPVSYTHLDVYKRQGTGGGGAVAAGADRPAVTGK